jgi:hypothetical protein
MEFSSAAPPDARHLVYEIQVRGVIDDEWSERLRGLRITLDGLDGDAPVTILRGELVDEAALNGVLRTLYKLGLSLISIRRAAEGTGEDDPTTSAER